MTLKPKQIHYFCMSLCLALMAFANSSLALDIKKAVQNYEKTPPPVQAGEQITVSISYKSVRSNDSKPVIGFVHGIAGASSASDDFPQATKDKIVALKPALWKVSDPTHYQIAKQYSPRIIVPPADTLYGYDPMPEPWKDWAKYERHFSSLVMQSLQHNAPVDYWNIWNEPQFGKYENPALVAEGFKRGYQAIKSADPTAKVIGPSTIGFSDKIMASFLDYADKNSLKFDAYNWHEFGRPEALPEHVKTMRALLAKHPSLGQPPFIIDEFATPEQHLQPGFAVAWFYYLEEADIKLSARACWDVEDSQKWSDCWNGLDGLFLKDNLTPQPLYWVFKTYSELNGSRIVTSSSDAKDTVALASKSDSTFSTIIGRFNNEKTPTSVRRVTVNLSELPATKMHVVVYRIPNPDKTPKALPQPLKIYEGDVVIRAGSANLLIEQFKDGDAYILNASF